MLDVTPFCFSGFTANTYLCRDRLSGRTLVIDPGADKSALSVLGNEKIDCILLTHAHFDHALIARDLAGLTGAPVCLHTLDAPLYEDPDKNASAYFGFAPLSGKADRLLTEGDLIELGESEIRVLHTPGHSPGSVCFLCEDLLFSGDTLFLDGCGRTDLFGGNEEEMRNSLSRLNKLSAPLKVYPGHGEAFLKTKQGSYAAF